MFRERNRLRLVLADETQRENRPVICSKGHHHHQVTKETKLVSGVEGKGASHSAIETGWERSRKGSDKSAHGGRAVIVNFPQGLEAFSTQLE
uniref:Uncharacterized protein n=1 Tax=Caenorhabditis japonica TaxID=281687 RepID=A0A8R1IJ33_CAEJA